MFEIKTKGFCSVFDTNLKLFEVENTFGKKVVDRVTKKPSAEKGSISILKSLRLKKVSPLSAKATEILSNPLK